MIGLPRASPKPLVRRPWLRAERAAPASAAFAGRERSAAPDVGPRQEANEPDFSFDNLGFRPPPPKAADEATAPEAAPLAPAPAAAPKERPRATFALPPRVPAKSVPAPGPWPSEPASAAAEPEAPAQATPANGRLPGNEHDWLERALAGIEPERKRRAEARGRRGPARGRACPRPRGGGGTGRSRRRRPLRIERRLLCAFCRRLDRSGNRQRHLSLRVDGRAQEIHRRGSLKPISGRLASLLLSGTHLINC